MHVYVLRTSMLYMNFLPSLFPWNLRLQHLKVSYQYL